jgi:hypothetical protein
MLGFAGHILCPACAFGATRHEFPPGTDALHQSAKDLLRSAGHYHHEKGAFSRISPTFSDRGADMTDARSDLHRAFVYNHEALWN